ncbi:MAG: hypothetical protein SVK08_04110 [Halobacteriota archaeon]|nr:hypothetical protein [Halobacteriota archaeon]
MAYILELPNGKKENFDPLFPKRVELYEDDAENGGFVLVTGKVKIADGTLYDAILLFDENSSGEHWGTYFLLKDKIVSQDDDDFIKRLGKTESEIFPYKYKRTAPIYCEDHHVNKNGWSK